jgi:hypothetical protein
MWKNIHDEILPWEFNEVRLGGQKKVRRAGGASLSHPTVLLSWSLGMGIIFHQNIAKVMLP